MTIDYQVHFVDYVKKECITKNEDDSYTIFINSNLSAEQQSNEFLHAYNHILRNDFHGCDADQIERECHDMETAGELCPTE